MLWVGIGLIIIGLALIGLVVFLIKPLNNLASLFGSLQQTTDELPETVDKLTTQTTTAIGTGVVTLDQLNNQIKELSPIFYTIGDAGRATNHLSTSMVNAVTGMKENTADADNFANRKNLEGLYGAATLGYMFYQKNKEQQAKKEGLS